MYRLCEIGPVPRQSIQLSSRSDPQSAVPASCASWSQPCGSRCAV